MNFPHEQHPDLSSNDRQVLDALMDNGFDIEALEPLSESDRARARRLLTLFGLMHDYPVDDPEDVLIDATLAGIDRFEREREQRLHFDQTPAEELSGGRRIAIPNLITVAAIVLIGVSIMWPVMSNLRRQSYELKQQNNLRYVMNAVDNYASDYGGIIPVARAGFSDVRSLADTINMTPMVAQDYVRLTEPGTDRHIGTPDDPTAWMQNNLVLFLGDQHPITEALRQRRLYSPVSIFVDPSAGRRNILTPDGAILILDTPERGVEITYWRVRGAMWLGDDIKPKQD